MKRTFHYVFANFEKVCDILDTAAHCSQKCERSEQTKFWQFTTFYRQTKFWQFTTFYRVHCVNYEEEIEQHLKCLSNAAIDVDSVCKDKCSHVDKLEPGMDKEERVARACKAVECSTVCYFHEFAGDCPKAKDLLVRINLDQINEVALSIHPKQHELMSHECKHIHDLDYMKAAMLASFDQFD
ncbi:unnamed protein product, partial [Mesorhabditis belari]|uniref:Chondroitin proteoglycan 4 domain-containing protein n=1 Tax=Mesorhabditis belari TaxID=2138241 RepID=A0AAF3FR30_9BILA